MNNSVSVGIKSTFSETKLIFLQAACWTARSIEVSALNFNFILMILIVFYRIKIEL
jgi:hypothetical protein